MHGEGTWFAVELNRLMEPALTSEQAEEEDQETFPYNLRPLHCKFLQVTTFLDDDDSGDFDPIRELVTGVQAFPVAKPSVPRAATSATTLARQPKPEVLNLRRARNLGLEKNIVLKISRRVLQSPKARVLMNTLNSETQGMMTLDRSNSDDGFENFTEVNLQSIVPSWLRERMKSTRRADEQTQGPLGLDASRPSSDSLTLGHPASRGCRACFEIGQHCTLVEGSVYPCYHCRTEGEDCELITEPLQKRSCQSCVKRRHVCSFRTSIDHRGDCVHCKKIGFRCIAGPLSGYTRSGPSLDCNDHNKKTRKWNSRRPLTTPTRKHSGPDLINKVLIPALMNHDTEKTTRAVQGTHSSRGNFAPSSPPYVVKTIYTQFTHPIEFFYEPPSNGTKPCHWCDDIFYGLLGNPMRKVTVWDHKNGSGYVEVRGGHDKNEAQASRMCVECTLLRVGIIGCREHRIIPSKRGSSAGDLWEAEVTSSTPADWCHVCVNQAAYACGRGKLEGHKSPERTAGCGLQLCEDCAADLLIRCEKDLTKLLIMRKGHPKQSETLRADAEFISEYGHIVERFG